jgi:hypothetical protein
VRGLRRRTSTCTSAMAGPPLPEGRARESRWCTPSPAGSTRQRGGSPFSSRAANHPRGHGRKVTPRWTLGRLLSRELQRPGKDWPGHLAPSSLKATCCFWGGLRDCTSRCEVSFWCTSRPIYSAAPKTEPCIAAALPASGATSSKHSMNRMNQLPRIAIGRARGAGRWRHIASIDHEKSAAITNCRKSDVEI